MRKTGNGADNSLSGGGGDDVLRGKGGDDSLKGRGGSDELYGGAGDDLLMGGAGMDVMKGGKGADTYVIMSADEIDAIVGFRPGVDKIYLYADAGHVTPGPGVFAYEGNTISYEGAPVAIIKAGLPLTDSDFILG